MNKFSKISSIVLLSATSALSATTVTNQLNINSGTLALTRNVINSGTITLSGASVFNGSDHTITNTGIIDISRYTGEAIAMTLGGESDDNKGLILGTESSQISADKISNITGTSRQNVYYYYDRGSKTYKVLDTLQNDYIQIGFDQTDIENGVDQDKYSTVGSPKAWINNFNGTREDILVDITNVADNADINRPEAILNLDTTGLDPVISANSTINFKLSGSAQIQYKDNPSEISFLGDNSAATGTQDLPTDCDLTFGTKSLFPSYIDVSTALQSVTFNGNNTLTGTISTKNLTVNSGADVTVENAKTLSVTGDCNIEGTLTISAGATLRL